MQHKLYLTFVAMLLTAATAWPQQDAVKKSVGAADPCPEATTDEARTNCWEDLAQKADAGLAATYQKIQKAIRDKIASEQGDSKSYRASTLEKLRTAQLAWRHYRDAQCDAEEQQYEGGTIAPSIRSGCVKELSDRRREELQKNYAIYLQP